MTAFPGRTASPELHANRPGGLLWLDLAQALLLAATMLSLLAGVHPIHVVAGVFLLVGCGVHLALHGRWIRAVILNTPKNVTPALRRQRRLFWELLILGLLCGLSGSAGLPFIHSPHVFLPLLCCAAPVHILSGLAFTGLNVYHILLHRSWFLRKLQPR